MIDLHCHLLPGLDDGPADMADALAMARLAVDNGISRAIVTPHIHPGRYDNSRSGIGVACANFAAELAAASIPLELGYAAEVRVSAEIVGLVELQQLPFLGQHDGYQLLLLEFPHSHVPPGSEKLLRWLLDRQIKPLIAHPERNKEMMRKPQLLEPFVEMGCLLQLTAAAVAGGFGEPARLLSRRLLERQMVAVLASDAHNMRYRPPELEQGRAVAADILGETAAWQLVRDTPMALTASQFGME